MPILGKSGMYEAFEKFDGSHPWRDACRDGYVDYRARMRAGGSVAYFNFDLARQMQLVPANHADHVTPALEKIVLDSFALQIINEYDLSRGQTIPEKSIKPGTYMATRYLQAQHKDKRGLNSGDGRATWATVYSLPLDVIEAALEAGGRAWLDE